MKMFTATVRVAKSGGVGTMVVPVRVIALNAIAAKAQLDALYGRGNVVSVPRQSAS
jgi:hypothetical protein